MAQDRALQAQHDTIRVPVYSSERYRKEVTPYLDQEYINCYPEKIKDLHTGESEIVITKRPGLASASLDLFATTGAASRATLRCKANISISQLVDVYVCAMFDSASTNIYIVQYRPAAGTSTLIGTLATGCTIDDFVHINEAQVAVGGAIKPSITAVYTKYDKSASTGAYAASSGGVFTVSSLAIISAAAFPVTVGKIITGPMQQMNGIFYVMTTDGTIYNSGSTAGTPNDPTLWNALGTILTYQYPDGGIGVYRYKHHIVAFGTDSVEFLNDIGSPPPASPLERTEQAFIKFGALNANNIINVDDTLYWIAYSSTDTLGVWKLEGYTPTKISTAKQDYIINANNSDLNMFTILVGNKKHIGINGTAAYTQIYPLSTFGDSVNDTFYTSQTGFVGKGVILLYSLEDNFWWNWTISNNSGIGKLYPTVAFPGSVLSSTYKQYIFESGAGLSNARVLTLAPSFNGSFVDSSPDDVSGNTAIPVCAVVQFSALEFGNANKKRINRLSLIFSSMPDVVSGNTSKYSISLFNTKKNFIPTTGSNTTSRYIPYPSVVQDRYYFNNLGTARSWSFCIACLSKDSFSLKAIELDVEQGIH